MICSESGKQLVWDVRVVDALAPSRLNQDFLCKPGTTVIKAEALKVGFVENQKQNQDNTGRFDMKNLPKSLGFFFAETSLPKRPVP